MERILHFTPGFRFGGVETLLMGLYRHIDRDRVQFDFVTDNIEQMDDFEEIRSMGGRVHQFGRYLDNPIRYQRKFAKVIGDMDPLKTVFHGHDAMRSGPLLLACKRRGIKRRILHSHTDSFEGSRRQYVARPILSLTNMLATQFLACSTEAGRFMFPGRDFSVFNNAIDLNQFAFNPAARALLRGEMGIGPDAVVIGHTGRFTFQKNHKWIIEVFSEFVRIHPDSHLLLVGTGPLEDEMRNLVIKYGLGAKVIFTGRQSEVSKYLSAMDLFILPSHYEGLGISLIESQANGLRALASNVITNEVCLTKAVSKLDLDAPSSAWAEALASLHAMGRLNSSEQIRTLRVSGYDIGIQWRSLIEFYGCSN